MPKANTRPATREDHIEAQLAAMVLDSEMKTSEQNASRSNRDFEDMIDMLECKRTQKDYDWMSDIFIPEYASQVLTLSASDASRYFANRDFVEPYLQDDSDDAKKKCGASKRLINRTLNNVELYYFQKFMRARTINDMASRVYARMWWEREDVEVVLRHDKRAMPMDTDIYGNPVTEDTEHLRDFKMGMVPVMGMVPKVDRFGFDVLDGRNVFTPPGYWYSVQEMPWITVRFESSYSKLKNDEKRMGYVNLDRVKDMDPPQETETSQASANDDGEMSFPLKTPEKPLDIYERHGWMWCKVTKRNEWKEPVDAEPGIDENGNPADGSEYLKVTLAFASNRSRRVLIRFQPIPYRDTRGNAYYPITRGMCFIHPTKDGGIGDGTLSKELQIAVNDNINMGFDRERLAMLPTLKTKRGNEENPTIYFAPGHAMELDDVNDVAEVKIESKLETTLGVAGFLATTMQRVKATGPSQYGDVPQKASTSATAVAGAEQHANTRNSYRDITFEYTFLQEFYRIIMLMTWQFSHYDTAKKLLGDRIQDFDPAAEYLWKPVSAAIETEYSKATKITHLKELFQISASVPNQNTAVVLNKLLLAIATLMGDEYVNQLKGAQFDTQDPNTATMGRSPAAGGNETGAGAATNQSGVPMSGAESSARMAVQ